MPTFGGWPQCTGTNPQCSSSQVNIVCTKVKGEPLYEVVKPLAAHQELVVFYLPEGPARPEELFFVHMRSTLYRRTMDSILEGECLAASVCQ